MFCKQGRQKWRKSKCESFRVRGRARPATVASARPVAQALFQGHSGVALLTAQPEPGMQRPILSWCRRRASRRDVTRSWSSACCLLPGHLPWQRSSGDALNLVCNSMHSPQLDLFLLLQPMHSVSQGTWQRERKERFSCKERVLFRLWTPSGMNASPPESCTTCALFVYYTRIT